ncbi:MAG: aromatic ring-hydroxylating dioxygenase subunit alpha [Porticoccaceae bacterium]|nr:aromatic ring-hydroxylating dioxygenase subunit alpha [Porticoccaceae bacterium]
MQHALQVELTKKTFAHIDADTTDMGAEVLRHPVSEYTCPDWFSREKATLFRDYPLFMGLSGLIPEAGDYLAEDHGEIPTLLIRGDDGIARAFVNMCRHRGTPLAKGCGRSASFTCPYHAWNYNKQGELVGLPDKRSFPDVDPAQEGLIPLPTLEKHGMLWVIPNPKADNDQDLEQCIDAHLAGLGGELASYGFGTYHADETRTIERRANWKQPIETFLEAYHFNTLHKNTVAPLFFHNMCLFEPFGLNHREAVIRKSIESQRDKPESEWDFVKHTGLAYQLFPNTIFVIQADHVETWRVFPSKDRVDECVIRFDCYVPEPVTEPKARKHWDANIDLAFRTVDEEDYRISEDIQRAYLSNALEEVIVGRNEPSLGHYKKSIQQAVVKDQ